MKKSFPKILLHLEGLAVFVVSIILFSYLNGNWILFLVLFLVPDLTFFAYLINKKIGSYTYNIMHTYFVPIILITISIIYDYNFGTRIAIIWFAHIGMDRSIGYGLKYPKEFKETHMGKV